MDRQNIFWLGYSLFFAAIAVVWLYEARDPLWLDISVLGVNAFIARARFDWLWQEIRSR